MCFFGKHDKGGYPSDDNNDTDDDDNDDDKGGVGGHPRGDSLVPMLAKPDSPVVLSFTALPWPTMLSFTVASFTHLLGCCSSIRVLENFYCGHRILNVAWSLIESLKELQEPAMIWS